MAGLSVVAAGAALGIRHALEADHLAAVATLLDRDADRSALVGASWGLGHSLTVVAVGLGLLVLGVRLPDPVTVLVELAVGLVLVALGVRLLASLPGGSGLTRHDHGAGPHHHLAVGDLAVGLTHGHLEGESFVVGVLHGVAGSGALVVLLVAAAPSADVALGFLAGFSVLSVVTMAAVAALWGRTLGTAYAPYLEAAAGLLGVAVGASIVAAQATSLVPF